MTLGARPTHTPDAGGLAQPSLGSERSDDPRYTRPTHTPDAGGIAPVSNGFFSVRDCGSTPNIRVIHAMLAHFGVAFLGSELRSDPRLGCGMPPASFYVSDLFT